MVKMQAKGYVASVTSFAGGQRTVRVKTDPAVPSETRLCEEGFMLALPQFAELPEVGASIVVTIELAPTEPIFATAKK